jgi:sulfonate transport system substrate-binding protein
VGFNPAAPEREAILVPADSAIATVSDLKRKKAALNKGSNVHCLLGRALQQAGVAYSEIEPCISLRPMPGRVRARPCRRHA